MTIPFTQYMMPNGFKNPVEISLDEETEAKAQQILAKGYRFECEMLSDYRTCSFSITHPTLDEGEPYDVVTAIATNGPGIRQTITHMIMSFDLDKEYTL